MLTWKSRSERAQQLSLSAQKCLKNEYEENGAWIRGGGEGGDYKNSK